MQITLGQQYNVGEKPTVILFFCFLFWCPYMFINLVSVQYNGGFLPEIIMLTLCDNISGTLSIPHYAMYFVEFLSSQPMFRPKPFDCSGGLAAFRFLLETRNTD